MTRSANASSKKVRPTTKLPAVPIKKSIKPGHLVCLEDGKKVTLLKRYLHRFRLTPAQYRAKWRLPTDYPMVPPLYSIRRSKIAKKIGLGRIPTSKRARTRRRL